MERLEVIKEGSVCDIDNGPTRQVTSEGTRFGKTATSFSYSENNPARGMWREKLQNVVARMVSLTFPVCKVEIILGELTGRYISCHGLLVFTVWYTHPQLYIQRHNYSSMSMINICIQKPTHSTLTVCTHGQMKVLRGSVTFWYFVEVSHFCTECTALLFPIKWVFGSN